MDEEKKLNEERKKLLIITIKTAMLFRAGLTSVEDSTAFLTKIAKYDIFNRISKEERILYLNCIPLLVLTLAMDECTDNLLPLKTLDTAANFKAYFESLDIDIGNRSLAINNMEDIFGFDVTKSPSLNDDLDLVIGDLVMISHEIFTYMLVSSDGVQLKSMTPELLNIPALVVELDCKTPYLCEECSEHHEANVKIQFEDYNILFYIDKEFLELYVKKVD
jgi:hypothetical protein